MFKKVLMMFVIFILSSPIFSLNRSNLRPGVSIGLFYTEKDFLNNNSNIAQQVDSMTLFMANMKFGFLLRVGYDFHPLLSLGVESGPLFNSFQQNVPLRLYGKIGTSLLNIKPLVGASLVREITYMGSGLQDIAIGGTFDFGCKLELFHTYVEFVRSISLSDSFLDSTKISFGYTLFIPNIR